MFYEPNKIADTLINNFNKTDITVVDKNKTRNDDDFF